MYCYVIILVSIIVFMNYMSGDDRTFVSGSPKIYAREPATGLHLKSHEDWQQAES